MATLTPFGAAVLATGLEAARVNLGQLVDDPAISAEDRKVYQEALVKVLRAQRAAEEQVG